MDQSAFDFQTARTARDAGMQQAIQHAEELHPKWGDQAYDFLCEFAKRHASFISEDVSDATKLDPAFPQPPTDRAWGSIYRRAAKDRLIVQDGLGRSRRRHASICPRWRSCIAVGVAA